jgi:hypothetical protein
MRMWEKEKVEILNHVTKEGLTEKVPLNGNLTGGKDVSHADTCREILLGLGTGTGNGQK